MKSRLLGTIQFLTVLPVGGGTANLGESAAFLPLVGLALGASAGALLDYGDKGPLAALITVAYLMTVTGCLHEDGLADVADAIRAGRTRETMLLILKDSRIGTYGAAALLLSVLIRWQAMTMCQVNPVYGLAAALALSRSSLVVMAALTPAVGEGLGQAFGAGISRAGLFLTLAQAGGFAYLAGWRHGIAMLLGSAVVIGLERLWFLRRLGGVNGDCLGATCQTVEITNLMILAWRPSF